MPQLFVINGSWAMLIVRCVLGLVFVVHGWPKVKDLKQNAANFEMMGFKPGVLFGTIVGLLEFFGGIMLILGYLTMLVSALFAIEFVVIIVWKLGKKMPFVNGWELDLIILAALIVIFALGAGPYSLDQTALSMTL